MSKTVLVTATAILLASSVNAIDLSDIQAIRYKGPGFAVRPPPDNKVIGGPVELPDWLRSLQGSVRRLEEDELQMSTGWRDAHGHSPFDEDEEQWNGEVYGEVGHQGGQTNWKVGGKIVFDENDQQQPQPHKKQKRPFGYKNPVQYCKTHPNAPSCVYKNRTDVVTFDEDELWQEKPYGKVPEWWLYEPNFKPFDEEEFDINNVNNKREFKPIGPNPSWGRKTNPKSTTYSPTHTFDEDIVGTKSRVLQQLIKQAKRHGSTGGFSGGR